MAERVRILYTNHTGVFGGGEQSLIDLIDGLPDDVEVVLGCPEGPLGETARAHGVEVHQIPGTDGSLRLHPTRTARALGAMAHAAIELRRLASSVGADVIHANSIRAGLVAAAASLQQATVIHVRDCLPGGAVPALTRRTIKRSADAVITNSEYTRSTLGPGGADARVVHNAVDLERFESRCISRNEARMRLGMNGDGPVLAVLAQITPWKAQDDAIRIAADLRRTYPELRLVLVGSVKFDNPGTRYDNGAYLRSLESQVSEQGFGEVVSFLGEREDVPEILRAVDLLLVPSWEEPFGRAIVEAMASRVPVAATNVGGPPEIVSDGETGLLLPPRRPRLWAAAIDDLLANPARLAAMGERGREEVHRRFDIGQHVAEVMSVYRDVLANNGDS
jgi:glycosyltransferase involved in cell wall biosynthesis